MPFIPDADGTITTYQGDTGDLIINGIPVDQNYRVYFAIQDKKRNLIGDELQVAANKTSSIVFFLTSDYTDLLTVPQGKQYEIYTYGIKACETESSTEDTLFVSDGNYGTQNMIIVYPRKVIGG